MDAMTRIYTRGPAISRAAAHIIIGADGCWIWSGALSTSGYARMNIGGGKYAAVHRVTYEHFRGPIPHGHELDHLCRTRNCVNPWHLEAVTHRENVLRGAGDSARAHRAGSCSHGHSLHDAHRDSRGRVRNCRTCRQQKRRAGLWK